MAQLVVRNLDEAVKERLKQRAAQNGRSLEGEVREILNLSVAPVSTEPPKSEKGLGTLLVEHFAGVFPPDFLIPDFRDEQISPAKFDE